MKNPYITEQEVDEKEEAYELAKNRLDTRIEENQEIVNHLYDEFMYARSLYLYGPN